jgi:hypothetical protein
MVLNYLSGWGGGGVMSRQMSDILGATGDRETTSRMLKIGEAANRQGSNWGDAEFQRAVAAGYSAEDVNAYLKWSGLTPQGNFGVAGFNKEMQMGGSGDGRGFSTAQTPYYRYFGPSTAAPAAPTTPSTPSTDGNYKSKELVKTPGARRGDDSTISNSTPDPKFMPGGASSEVDSGMAQGFRRKKSSGRTAGLTTQGTKQFKITGQNGRSSGLNIGV